MERRNSSVHARIISAAEGEFIVENYKDEHMLENWHSHQHSYSKRTNVLDVDPSAQASTLKICIASDLYDFLCLY
jgi:hypothetical protein